MKAGFRVLKRLLLVLVFMIGIPTNAVANEATPAPTQTFSSIPTPTVEPSPTPTPTTSSIDEISVDPYTPPAEASQGVGGWAVVDPKTGRVLNVIVMSIDVFNAWGGRMPLNSECPGCLLRFQTRATADGNVAGWRDATYDSSDQTFILGNTYADSQGTTRVTRKLVPSLTALDGVNLETGIVNVRTEFISRQVNGIVVKLTNIQENFSSQDETVVEFQNWQSFEYPNSKEMSENLEADVTNALFEQGYVIDEPAESGFVDTVKKLTKKITGFFGGLFSSE